MAYTIFTGGCLNQQSTFLQFNSQVYINNVQLSLEHYTETKVELVTIQIWIWSPWLSRSSWWVFGPIVFTYLTTHCYISLNFLSHVSRLHNALTQTSTTEFLTRNNWMVTTRLRKPTITISLTFYRASILLSCPDRPLKFQLWKNFKESR